ncbi:MAG: hypothetical protein HZC01_02680 [Candidatus Kerfeldbacteria bacterium]|nr:hypothetical protein [Candidatus Kerfeldbacteria bacterium]
MPKSLKLVQNTLQGLFEVYAGEFDPDEFFADTSRHDVMKLAVQLGRDGAITLDRIMEYVQASYDVSMDDAPAFAMKLFRTLQRLSEESDLPFSSDTPTTRRPRKTRQPKGKTVQPSKDASSPGRSRSANSPLSKFITACGDEAAATQLLTDAIRKAGKEKAHGAIGRAFEEILVNNPKQFNFLKKLNAPGRTYIVKQLGIDAKKVLKSKE